MRISTKLSAVVAGIFLTIGVVGIFSVHRLGEVADATTAAQAKNVARSIAGMVTYQAMTGHSTGTSNSHAADDIATLQSIVNFIAASSKYDVEIFDAQRLTIADVVQSDIGKQIEIEREKPVAMTMKDGIARAYTLTNAEFPDGTRQVVVPVRGVNQKIIAALVLDYTPLYNESMELAQSSLWTIVGLTLGALCLSIMAGMFISRHVSRPLGHLRDAAMALSEGQSEVAVAIRSNDEIGELGKTFNEMARSMEAARETLQRRANDLVAANAALHDEIATRMHAEQSLRLLSRAIESSVNAILIIDIVDKGYPIIYANPAFEQITGHAATEVLGRESNFMLGHEVNQSEAKAIRSALDEYREWHGTLRAFRKDGTLFWSEWHIAPVPRESGGIGHYIAVLTDITAQREQTEQLAYQANFDALTGLANRNLLKDRLEQAIVKSRRHGDEIAVLFVDLDDFKLINDTLGHNVGDTLLKAIADRLKTCVRESDTVARIGGDEFVLLLVNQADSDRHADQAHNHAAPASLESGITLLMQKLIATVSAPLMLAERDIRMNCSIGISMYPQDGENADTLLKNADVAMYRAKELGRNGFQFFTRELHERVRMQMELGTSLRQALEREELELFFQPQVSLRSGKIVGVEALVRWNHPEKGLVGPASFIEFAEQSGLILPMGEWIMMRACAQNKAWQDAGLEKFPIAVNVSAKQCAQQDIAGIVRRALAESGLEAQYLEIELTESLSMAAPEKSVPLMYGLKEIGVKLAIDDFGTGYSNMSYLKRFPIDRLKLDISFVREITSDAGSLAISDAIITMSHSLQLEVVAEGVETEGQLELLKSRNCDLIQGYYFSRPVRAHELAAMLEEGRCLSSKVTGRTENAPAILVLDDDPHVLTLLDLSLRPEGYVLLLTAKADEAFELLARHEVAVILCDQRMPHISGVDFLTSVRRMYPDSIRILLSAYEDFEATRQAINAGAVYKFIEKPWKRDELRRIVEEAYLSYRRIET